jgi:formate dehydrogenase assembly factor FdhD
VDDGIVSEEWLEYRDQWSRVRGEIIQETDITLYVNGEELVSILATPMEQDQLALGFLRNEGFIQSLCGYLAEKTGGEIRPDGALQRLRPRDDF